MAHGGCTLTKKHDINKRKKGLIFFIFFCFITPSLFSAFLPEPTRPWIITEVHYEIKGKTRINALEKQLDLSVPMIFKDRASMDEFLKKTKQKLIDLRFFESVHLILKALDDGMTCLSEKEKQPCTLTIQVEDSGTFLPLIVPLFDTNNAFSLESKIRYGNAFGSLMGFSMDGELLLDRNGVKDGDLVRFWNMETAMENILILHQPFRISFSHAHDRLIRREGRIMEEHYQFDRSALSISTSFNLGNDLFYEAGPDLAFTYNYKIFQDSKTFTKEPQSYGFYQSMKRNRIHWKGNFRSGSSRQASVLTRLIPSRGFKASVNFSTIHCFKFKKPLGYSLRLLGELGIGEERFSLGRYLRGVADFNLAGLGGFFLNNSLAFTLFKIKTLGEFQLQPFMDMAMIIPRDRAFIPRNHTRMTLGMDFLLYPEKIKSVELRITLGYDLFGPGLPLDRYELLLSTSLFY